MTVKLSGVFCFVFVVALAALWDTMKDEPVGLVGCSLLLAAGTHWVLSWLTGRTTEPVEHAEGTERELASAPLPPCDP
jgi:hypothetical protein